MSESLYALGKGRYRSRFISIEDMAIIKNLDFDRRIINKSKLRAHGDAAFSKLEWSTTGCFLDFLGRFLIGSCNSTFRIRTVSPTSLPAEKWFGMRN